MVQLAMALAIFLFAGNVLAGGGGYDDVNIDIGIGNENINNNTATAVTDVDVNQNQEQNQSQLQKQEQEQKQRQEQFNNQTTNFNDMREHTSALPGISGSLMSLQPIVADGKWHQLLCDQYTVEELKIMKDSSSYANREGFFLSNWFSSPLEHTYRVRKFKGEISDQAIVRLVADHPGNRTLAEYEGSGAIKAPLSAMVAYAGLEGVIYTGQYAMVVTYRVRDIAHLSGVGVGSGAAAAVSSNDSGNSSALSVGAIIGWSEAYAEYVYDIKVKIVIPSAEAFAYANAQCFPPAPPVVQQAPPPVIEKLAPCDPTSLLERLEQYKKEIIWCKYPCWNNQKLRLGKGNVLMELFYCTGNRQYLVEAIHEYGIAERDYLNGRELAPGQKFGEKPRGAVTPTLPEAQEALYKVHCNWSLAIRELEGRDAQASFARQKQLDIRGDRMMPTGQADLKY